MGFDVVYPLGTGSKFKDWELRFSLRSIETYLSGYDRVFVIGHKPAFLTNVIHIPASDNSNIPDTNILNKLKKACDSDCSEDFIMFNDDHYLLDFYSAKDFPAYYEGDISDYLKKRSPDGYWRRVRNTLNYLKENNHPTKFYDIHTPIVYNKQKFVDNVFNKYNQDLPDGMILKSLYANQTEVNSVEMKDGKSKTPPTKPETKILSTNPAVSGAMQRFLLESFPHKSKFEL